MNAFNKPCEACRTHYGDNGECDKGLPTKSPHRSGVPFPQPTTPEEVFQVCADRGHVVAAGEYNSEAEYPFSVCIECARAAVELATKLAKEGY